jgi:hypothetical protein
MPADKLVRVFQKAFSQIHREKIKFARRKSELDFESKAQLKRDLSRHNIFGWQGKSATPNGIFEAKKA